MIVDHGVTPDPDLRRQARRRRVTLWSLVPYVASGALFGWALTRVQQSLGYTATFVELAVAWSGLTLCHWVPALVLNRPSTPVEPPDITPWLKL